jgi:GT2 family glycosyltransferase
MISIVIPNLNSPIIDSVLDALRSQTVAPLEILVVGLDHPGLVREDELVRLLSTGQPISPARARNLGARQAVGEYVLFLDADCIAAPDLVERMLARHRQGHAVVGSSMIVEAGNYWVLCDNLLSFASFLSQSPAGTRAYLPSFGFGISRALFNQVGGFDEGFTGAAGEDVDLCLRLREAGYTLYFDPAARVTHWPTRVSARAMQRHLRMFGRAHYRVQRMHTASMRSPLAYLPRASASLILVLSPLLACKDIALLFPRSPELRAHPHAAAGMIWGRIGWYLGVIEALLAAPPRSV